MSGVERFAAMGTRVELHLFGATGSDALAVARRAIEAVDDALTIHRPSATTALNASLMAGRSHAVDDPLLLAALIEIEAAHALTLGLFDPAADAARPGAGWNAIRVDRDAARIEAARPLALDFGGFGKGFALDQACDALRAAGVASAFLVAGESSIAVMGEHPLGGGWPVAIPDPLAPDQSLVELELRDAALSISSTLGAGAEAPGRAPMIRPNDGSCVTAARTAIAIDRRGSRAEMLSTALLVADAGQAMRLIAEAPAHRFLFNFSRTAAAVVQPREVVA
ncbi:thiamine biosynthesis lipoprotein ApbE [Sphingomonas naasensis]|uniref:FAD:protein FMN transferase n=1 Tax=Sphingomonas naasensis TaxID=1344951 RepID=A0A4S1WVJ5_9SPHN|nr:FAD:protein FMN transferase [Sphingomonas naasensis]NIJ19084.1 thiamine biosynthesis lipoprotein ApbE [Sphingomonas naasensis]TGX46280.1 FAD:protein FMN transferase [Sphingomonas naasensis]